jgi:hypothetical protein
MKPKMGFIAETHLDLDSESDTNSISWQNEGQGSPSKNADGDPSDPEAQEKESYFAKFFDNWKVGITIKNVTIEISQEIPTRPSSTIVVFIEDVCLNNKREMTPDPNVSLNSKRDSKLDVNFEANGILIGINTTGKHKSSSGPVAADNFKKKTEKTGWFGRKKKPEETSQRKGSSMAEYNNYKCLEDTNVTWIFSWTRQRDPVENVKVNFKMFGDSGNKREIKL